MTTSTASVGFLAAIKRTAVHSLLEKRKDLDVAGKVFISDTVKSHGGYSDVYAGVLTKANGEICKVAVKKFRVCIQKERRVEEALAKELYIWSNLDHPRILRLIGFYIENGTGYPHLISEWMDNGTAWRYLAENPNADDLSLIAGIADGVSYLHSKEIIHSDLKPENVLISDRGELLICDLGTSRTLAASSTLALSTAGPGIRGTIRYISKDIFQAGENEASAYSKASDVWAFGMTIFALVTKHVPYYGFEYDAQIISAIADDRLPSWPEPLPDFFLDIQRICRKCWADSSDRETIDAIAKELRCLAQARRDILSSILEDHADLDLTGKVKVSDFMARIGRHSDIHVGYHTPDDGLELKVAAKRARVNIMEERKFEKGLARELRIWSQLKHPQILPLEGFVIYIGDRRFPSLISRWMENGTSMKFLKKNPGTDVLSIIIRIAEGIQYLHSMDVVHLNIEPENILISDSGKPLICDFGISRMLTASPSYPLNISGISNTCGTIRYLSREIFLARGEEASAFSKASDVWAFGMIMLALLTKTVPFYDIKSDVQVMFGVADGELPSWPTTSESDLASEQRLRDICSSCWLDSTERPAIDDVLARLYDLQHDLPDPKKFRGRALEQERSVQESDENRADRDDGLEEAIAMMNDRTSGGEVEAGGTKLGRTTSCQAVPPKKKNIRAITSSGRRIVAGIKSLIPPRTRTRN